MPFDDKPELELYFGVLLCQKDDSAEVIFAWPENEKWKQRIYFCSVYILYKINY